MTTENSTKTTDTKSDGLTIRQALSLSTFALEGILILQGHNLPRKACAEIEKIVTHNRQILDKTKQPTQ